MTRRVVIININVLPRVPTSSTSDDVIFIVVVIVIGVVCGLRTPSRLHHVRIARVCVAHTRVRLLIVVCVVHGVVGVNRRLVVVLLQVVRVSSRCDALRCVDITFVRITWVVRQLRATSGSR